MIAVRSRPTFIAAIAVHDDTQQHAITSLIIVLRQLAHLIETATDEQYTARPTNLVSSPMSGHLRHCLDHVEALLAGIERGVIDYDRRERGTQVETCRRAALDVIHKQVRQLGNFPARSINRAVKLVTMINSTLPPIEVTSSVGRELAFVLSHTIHHNALIAVIARSLNVPLPERFGYAPSTLAYLEKTPCVQ